MAKGTIIGPATYDVVTYMPRIVVEAKRAWSDSWTWLPYVYALRAEEAASPQSSHATLAHDFGTILREDMPVFDYYPPLDLMGSYVRLLADTGWSATPIPFWHGYVIDDEDDGGRQTFRAVGLEYFLDEKIMHSWTTDGQIDRPLRFNEQQGRGDGIIGNAYTSGASPVFGGSELWTNLDILNYLVTNVLSASPVTWSIAGLVGGVAKTPALQMLDEREEMHDLYGLTVREALDRLVDRRRGVGWRVKVNDAGTSAYIETFSMFDKEYWIGGRRIRANSNLTEVIFDDVIDIELRIRYSAIHKWDQVVVRGGPVYSTATYSANPLATSTWAPLVPDWTNAQQSAYESAADDNERRAEKYENVFCRFRVPDDWDWTMNGAALVPTVDEDGELDFSTGGIAHREGHVWERELPFETIKEGDQVDYRKPFAFCYEPTSASYQLLDRLVVQEEEDSDSVTEYPTPFYFSDRELALTLRPRINHLFAALHWSPPEGASEIDSVIAWDTIQLTAMVETDAHLQVTRQLTATSSTGARRTLVIEEPDAVAWYVVPGTVTDVSGGTRDTHPGGLVRNDVERLRALAAFAAAWYGENRQTIDLMVKSILLAHPVGSLIVSAGIGGAVHDIRTVVTSREWNFEDGTTRIKTGYDELRFRDLP
ncbi:MAG: hypothetical protein WC260_04125 [Candidatus Pacearchaeota archaeon]